MRKWFLFSFALLVILSACSDKPVNSESQKFNPPKKEMTALDHLNKTIEINKAMKGYESEYQARQLYEYYGEQNSNVHRKKETGKFFGTVQELQNPYAYYEKLRMQLAQEYWDYETWVVDGYKYESEPDIPSVKYYKSKFDEEGDFSSVAGHLRLLESIRDEIGSKAKTDGFSMEKENGMIQFTFDLNFFPKTKEKVERAIEKRNGTDYEFKKYKLKVYVDEKNYKLKKIVEYTKEDDKTDQILLQQDLTCVIKGEFAGKIEVPEHVKKSAISE